MLPKAIMTGGYLFCFGCLAGDRSMSVGLCQLCVILSRILIIKQQQQAIHNRIAHSRFCHNALDCADEEEEDCVDEEEGYANNEEEDYANDEEEGDDERASHHLFTTTSI